MEEACFELVLESFLKKIDNKDNWDIILRMNTITQKHISKFLIKKGIAKHSEADEIIRPNNGDFSYELCLPVHYDNEANISEITFDISRYGKHTHTLSFQQQLTTEQAIWEVEKYLSQPLTEEYFNMVSDDLLDGESSWEDAKREYSCRGDLLVGAKFLEGLDINDGFATITCGS